MSEGKKSYGKTSRLTRLTIAGLAMALILIALILGLLWFVPSGDNQESGVIPQEWAVPLGKLRQNHIEKHGVVEGMLVMHFISEDCHCSVDARNHLQDLQADHVFGDARQVHLNPDTPGLGIRLNPSLAIWNEEGRLIYAGAYSSGGICGEGLDFARTVMRWSLLTGSEPFFYPPELSCHCPEAKAQP